jgi:protein tyrosine phosphatase (PTP) superfamily phosphohydrolase (DUF442 family)
MADPEAIYNWRRLDDRITTSGQPTEAQLADIHALGVRHIINLGLHSHEKALPDEAASVSRLGMTYIHIPVDFQSPTDGDFARFCSAMEQFKDVPVHVHCIAKLQSFSLFLPLSPRCDWHGCGTGAHRYGAGLAARGRVGCVRRSLAAAAHPAVKRDRPGSGRRSCGSLMSRQVSICASSPPANGEQKA